MIRDNKRPVLVQFCLIIFLCFNVTACSDTEAKLSALADDALVLAFGDSLTYGTGSNVQTESYPAVLQSLIGRKVINAGVPGEVSEQGLKRLKLLLQELSPNLVILCHGANDLLRRLDISETEKNLAQMIDLIQLHGAEVVILAVPKPDLLLTIPDFYPQLADHYQVPAELSIIAELERSPKLKSDSIHPNAKGYRLMAERIKLLLQDHGAV